MSIVQIRVASSTKRLLAGLSIAGALLLLIACSENHAESSSDVTASAASAASADDLLPVDCLLPGQIRQLGQQATYVTRPRPIKTSAQDCRIRGGEYVAYDRADYATALKVWLPRAQEGDAEAQNNVGDIYQKGSGLAPDYTLAAAWYQKAADQGYSPAEINLGLLYEKGLGVPRDQLKALDWYRKASGLQEGQIQLASASTNAGDVEELTRALSREKQESTDLRTQVQQLDQELADTHSALQQRERQASEERKGLGSTRDELAKQQAALDTERRKLQSASDQVRRLEADRDRLAAERDRLARARESAPSSQPTAPPSPSPTDLAQIQAIKQQASAAQAEVDRARARFAEQQALLDRGQERLAQRQAELQTKQTEIARLDRDIDQLKQESDRRKQETEQLKKESDRRKQETDQLRNDQQALLDRGQERLAQRQAELQTKQTETARLDRDVDQLKQESDRRKQEIDQLRKEQQALLDRGQERLAQRQAELQTKQTEIARLDRDIDQLKQESDRRKQETDQLRKENERLKQETDQHHRDLSRVASRGPSENVGVKEDANKPIDQIPPGIDFGSYYALVIGNNDYQRLPKLETPVADAKAISQILSSKYGFKVTTLLNANRYQILSELNKMREKVTEKDNLLIYYAGHGELDKVNQRGNWLPVDAEPDSTANWIPNVAITDILNASSAKHILVISDSCYSGSLTRSALSRLQAGLSEEARLAWIRSMASQKSRTALTSGGLKPVIDTTGGQHSVFAQAVLDALSTESDVVEGQRLFQIVSGKVTKVARNVGVDQVPEYAPIQYAGHGGGEFFFVPTGAASLRS